MYHCTSYYLILKVFQLILSPLLGDKSIHLGITNHLAHYGLEDFTYLREVSRIRLIRLVVWIFKYPTFKMLTTLNLIYPDT